MNVHSHHDGASHHKDIRLFVTADDGTPSVAHFASAGGLPGPGRVGRWKMLPESHIPDNEQRIDRTTPSAKGHERITFESHDDADLSEHEGSTGITYLSVGGSRYAISGGNDGVHFVKNLDSAEKMASLDMFAGNPLAQLWLVQRAQEMGLVPPENTAQVLSPQDALTGGLQRALGTGLKTISLGFLGGLGAGAGWTLGKRLTGVSVPNNEKSAAEDDPAYSVDAPGESAKDFRPEDGGGAVRPADAAATRAHSMTESRFGLASGDPL